MTLRELGKEGRRPGPDRYRAVHPDGRDHRNRDAALVRRGRGRSPFARARRHGARGHPAGGHGAGHRARRARASRSPSCPRRWSSTWPPAPPGRSGPPWSAGSSRPAWTGLPGGTYELQHARASAVVNTEQMGGQPLALALGLAVAAVLSLALTVLSLVRRRRRELALLKALGMTRGQVRAVIAWQTTLTLADRRRGRRAAGHRLRPAGLARLRRLARGRADRRGTGGRARPSAWSRWC